MATIDLKQAHDLDAVEARRRAEALARSMEQRLGFRSKAVVDHIALVVPAAGAGERDKLDVPTGLFTPGQDRLELPGASGAIRLEGSVARVHVELPPQHQAHAQVVTTLLTALLAKHFGAALIGENGRPRPDDRDALIGENGRPRPDTRDAHRHRTRKP